MKKILLFLVLNILIFGCDKRGMNKPEISVISDKTEVFNSQSDRTVTLTFSLSGEKSYISNAKILVEYDSDLGTLIGTGSANYLFTDENGMAEALFQISSSAIGFVEITSRLDKFRTVEFTNKIIVHFKPTIATFIASPDTIEANGYATSVLKLQLSNSDKLDNVKIIFSTTCGTLTNDSIFTDETGFVQISFVSTNYPAQAIIHAHLKKCPEVTSNVNVWME